MDHDLSPEVNELRDMVRSFLDRKAPESAVREAMDSELGRDQAVWQQMAGQLGLQGLLVPEELGGQGTTFVEVGVVLEELGRSLLPGPYLSSAVLAVSAVLESGDAAAASDLLPGLAEGTTIGTVAFSQGLTGRPGESTVSATRAGDQWKLDGRVDIVLDAQGADLLLVVAPAGEELGLFAVTSAAAGIERTPLDLLDRSRRAALVELDGVEARRLGGDYAAAEQRLLSLAASGIVCELAGASQRILEMAVDYAKLREQFGKPIGSFQAVKHLCAEMFVTAESTTAVGRFAARTAVEDPAELAQAASIAKAYAGEACSLAAEQNIQVHGGIGFTWEHPAHLYLRKIKSGELLFGGSALHRERLATLLGLTVDAGSAANAQDVAEVVGV